jgi:thiamine-monophosphate kinase
MNEFSLIDHYFKNQKLSRPDVLLGIGDDAALLKVPSNCLLVLSMDTLIEGVHFPSKTAPFDIGYKALAVNLSDLAAMGAEPAWMTLALTLPEINTTWLDEFTNGLYQLAKQFNVQLIGGDTTRGSLAITIQVHGFVPPHQALCRHNAKVGDKIYVSGTLGDAGLGLQVALDDRHLPTQDKLFALQRLNKPTPRIQLGILLREIATSAIDISDGLLADLNHILKSSRVGARIIAKNIPLSSALQKLPLSEAQPLALTAGDDYELCFTIPTENESALMTQLDRLKINCYWIGNIEAEPGLRVDGFSGDLYNLGFQHFFKKNELISSRSSGVPTLHHKP